MGRATIARRAGRSDRKHDGVQAGTFGEHVATWSVGQDVPNRSVWPDRVYKMAREFVVFPKTLADDGCPAASTLFAVHKAIDPIVRFFLTDSLTRLRLTNLRPFMQAERYDENSLAEF